MLRGTPPTAGTNEDAAGIPLTLTIIPGKGHAWLFGPPETDALIAWLEKLKAP